VSWLLASRSRPGSQYPVIPLGYGKMWSCPIRRHASIISRVAPSRHVLSIFVCFWPTVLSVVPLAHCVVCLSSSVTFCIVAKWYVLAKNFLKERIGNQGQKVDFGGRAIFLFLVLPLRPPKRPFLLYFCQYSPVIGTRWYKWTF